VDLRTFLPAFDAARVAPAAPVRRKTSSTSSTFRTSVISLVWIALLIFIFMYGSVPAAATANGISGFSGKNGSTCTSCHSGSSSLPTVTLTGPTSVASGSTNAYTISVSTISSGSGGVDVAASAGTFAAGTGTKVSNGEIVHSSPSSSHSWTFSWTAPTVTATTTATLYAAAIDSYGGGTGVLQRAITVTAAAPTPTIGVSPAALTFSYQSGGAVPSAQNVAVSSSGTNFNYTASTSATWLAATPTSGTTPGSVSVSVNPQSLSAGTYTATVSISSPSASNSPKTVAVTLTVTAAQLPTLTANPTALTFNYQSGGALPSAQNVAVSSSGTNVNYTVSTSTTWLAATPASGTTPGSVGVSVNPQSLSAGTYTGSVSIASTGASNSPRTVAVTLNVTAAQLPTLTASPASLTYSYQIGGSAPAAQMVAISSGSAVNYTTSKSATWLSVTPASGTTPGNLSVSVNPSGLTAGTYTGNVTVTSSGASNSPKNVPVTLTVTAATSPTMTVSPLNLTFNYQSGGANPAAQTVNVTGSTALPYSTGTNAAWLSVSPASGTTPGSLSVSVNPSGMASGTYTGTVTVTGTGASNSPQKVSVTLAVTATPPTNPSLNISPGSISFSYPTGTSTTGTQNLSVTSSGSAMTISAAASGGAWLTVTPASGPTPATLKISANPTGLAAGTYNGKITITSSGAANSPQSVPVQLVVTSTGSGRLRVWPSRAVSFEYEAGHSDPSPRTVRVFSSGAPLAFTAAAHGGTWISVTPAGGTTPGSVSISVDPTGLASGTYTGNVYIAAQGATGVTVPVVLRVASGDDDGEGDDDGGGSGGDRLHAWPYAYDPAGSNTVAATWMDGTGAASTATAAADSRNQGLLLSKTSSASNQAQAGVVIRDVDNLSITTLGYDIRQGGQCTAKSPRFVVVTTDQVVHKMGCSGGSTQPAPATGWKRLQFDPAQAVPAIAPGTKVKSIHLVLDDGPESGASMVVLDNVNLNGKLIGKQ